MQDLIELGAMTLMVPGNLPTGCKPFYLTTYMSSIEEDYDCETGCLIWLNEFAEYHNEMLRIELNRIQERHPHTTIIYADYYNAAIRFYHSPSEYGTSVLPILLYTHHIDIIALFYLDMSAGYSNMYTCHAQSKVYMGISLVSCWM